MAFYNIEIECFYQETSYTSVAPFSSGVVNSANSMVLVSDVGSMANGLHVRPADSWKYAISYLELNRLMNTDHDIKVYSDLQEGFIAPSKAVVFVNGAPTRNKVIPAKSPNTYLIAIPRVVEGGGPPPVERTQYASYSISLPTIPEEGGVLFYQEILEELHYIESSASMPPGLQEKLTLDVTLNGSKIGNIVLTSSSADVQVDLGTVLPGDVLAVTSPEHGEMTPPLSIVFKFILDQ